MRDLNVVTIIGRLGRNPEIKYTANRKAVTTLSLAVQRDDKTAWVRCVAFGKAAEAVAQYAKKGERLAITGSLSANEWEDKNGKERISTEVVVNSAQFLSETKTAPTKDPDDIPF